MAITFPDNLFIGAGNPIDAKYLSSGNTAYPNVLAVCSRIPESQRYVGLTVLVSTGGTNAEYWFKDTIYGLVPKMSGGTGGGIGTITGGTNGLHVEGKNIALGGALTGDTIITDANGYGIQYGSDYSGTFIDESLVSKRYVDLRFSGTTYHIPVFNNSINGIVDTSLTFIGNTLRNTNNDLIIEVPLTKNLYLVGGSGGSATYNTVYLGKPTTSSAVTMTHICPTGLAGNISLMISSKWYPITGGSSAIHFYTPTVYLGDSSVALGIEYRKATRTLRLPQWGIVTGGGGNAPYPDAPSTFITGGAGYGMMGNSGEGGDLYICGGDAQGALYKVGGDVVIEGGMPTTGTTRGRITIPNLPLKTTESNVIYIDASGNLSKGLASGGTGTLTGATNGLTVSGMKVKLGGTLTETTTIVRGAGNTAGIEYFGYSSGSGFTDNSLIHKSYAITLNEKLTKFITGTFAVGDVIGFSGGTYNKAIADGKYNGEILGVVISVNGGTSELAQAGFVQFSTLPLGSGLTTNKTYFLSDTVAGRMTTVEPTTYGHVSKAVLIAYTNSSGWVLPYAGYVVSTGSTENVNGERVSLKVTQSLHSFYVNEVVGWSGGQYTPAIANGTYNGEVVGIVSRIIDPNNFEVTQSGYFSGFTGTSLSANTTYFLSNIVAGQLTTVKPTTLTHVVRPVLATTTAKAGWVLPYPGTVLISGSSGGGTGSTYAEGLGISISAQTISARVEYAIASGIEIPVKINNLGSDRLYIDSVDLSGFTGYTFVQSGGTVISQIGDVITIYSPTGSTGGFTGYTFVPSGATQISQVGNVVTIYTNPSGTTTTLVGSGNTSVNNISGNTWVIYSSGGTGSGTITGATNIGSTGGTIYAGTNGQTLQFKGIVGSGNTSVTQTGNNVVIYSSGGTEPVFTTNLTVSIASGKTFGRYENGNTILAIGKTARQVIQMAIAEPLEPTVNLSSSSQNLAFGLSAKTVNLTFSYTINSLGASVSGVSLQWRRNNSGTWSGLTTSTGATTYNHTIYETNRFNTQVINYRYTVTDTLGGTKTATYNRTPLAYTAPTVLSALNGTITSPETQTVREKGNVISSPSGSITATQLLVDITDWTLERRYNGGGWTILASGTGLNTQLVTISSTLDNTIPTSATSIDYRITYVDEYTNSTGGAQSISFKYFSYWGFNTNTTLTSAQISGLTNSNFLASQALTWSNVNTPASNYTYYAYPNTYSDITSIIKNGVNQDIGAWSQLSQVSVTNTYGEALNYKVWKTNATSAYGATDSIVIT